jgi:hypothetical protein
MRNYYALSDSYTGDNPHEYSHGFANKDKVIAFRSKEERAEWLKSTKLLKAKEITRREAMRKTKTIDGRKLVSMYSPDDKFANEEYVVMWESPYCR